MIQRWEDPKFDIPGTNDRLSQFVASSEEISSKPGGRIALKAGMQSCCA